MNYEMFIASILQIELCAVRSRYTFFWFAIFPFSIELLFMDISLLCPTEMNFSKCILIWELI